MTCQPGSAGGISLTAPSSTESPSTNTRFAVTGASVVVVGIVVVVVGIVLVVVGRLVVVVVAIDCETGAALAALRGCSSPVTAVISAASPMPATTANANATRRGLGPRRRWGMGGDGSDGHFASLGH